MRRSVLKAAGVLAAMLTLASTTASAQFLYSGTTAGGATWTRPDEGYVGIQATWRPNNLYSVFAFTAMQSGTFSFLSTSIANNGVPWDNFLLLYSAPFDPNAPETNLLEQNDDFGSATQSGFDFALVGGQSYELVTTGIREDYFGEFTNTISCGAQTSCGIVPGVPQSTVPEPSSVALMMAGLAGVFTVARRRKA